MPYSVGGRDHGSLFLTEGPKALRRFLIHVSASSANNFERNKIFQPYFTQFLKPQEGTSSCFGSLVTWKEHV